MLCTKQRLILNTPSSKIRSASMGLVEITGMAKGPHTIPARDYRQLVFLPRDGLAVEAVGQKQPVEEGGR